MDEYEDNRDGSLSNARKREGEGTDDSNPYEEFCSISVSTPKKKMRTVSPDAEWHVDTASISVKQHQSEKSTNDGIRSQNSNDDASPEEMDTKEANMTADDATNVQNISKIRTVTISYPCQGPGCQEEFKTVAEHDMHYNTRHRNICTECKRSLKSRHLLDLHLMEKHDSFFAILSLKKPMFMCLIDTCTLRFTNPEERRVHCLAEHPFLKKYLQTVSDSKVIAVDAFVSTVDPPKQKPMIKAKGEVKVKGNETKEETSASGTGSGSKGDRVTKKSAPITFGHHEGRFIPRQVFAMQKKKKTEKSPETEMVDLSDLQKSLQC